MTAPPQKADAPREVSPEDRAAINPFAPLQGLLKRPMASYYLVVATTGLLLAIGLMMVLSASSIVSYVKTGSPFTTFANQALYALLGLVAFVIALRLPVRLIRMIGYPILIISGAALLVLLAFPSLGVARNGVVRWIDVGPILWQPSESAKLGLALWGADVLVRKRKLMTNFKHLIVPLLPVSVVLVGLVGVHDLGTSMCLMLVLVALLWVSGVRLRVFGLMLGVGVVGVIGFITAKAERMDRITSFLNPFADPEFTGHQAVQGLYALSSGGFFGVGLGASATKWGGLPEAYNDFIFAVIGEELGLIGCVVVIGLFGVFGYSGFRVARRTADPYVRLTAAACTVWLTGQAFINMGAVVGLLPITGIPLPLISQGGSSLVLTLFVAGMLAGFARGEPEAAAMLNERGPTLGTRLFGMPPVPVLPAEGAGKRSTKAGASRTKGKPGPARSRPERR
ncbi:putative lipid II flippase FtsW [Fodinicola acaciae]|uniref:putative lipid II flippase FtsW n=1 Tax=Fodinicola acaciae TaxID=2681555 RepID=UPI001C9E618E|nr:putative lipid II flippase FtsW [Fodinicola acaciae]